MASSFLIVGNGEFDEHRIRQLGPGRTIIALDGAANKLYSAGIKPNIILGDLDSASAHTLKFFQDNGTKIISRQNQDYTDLEKAIYYCDKLQAQSIILTCVLGGDRTDHTLMALSCIKRYHNPIRSLSIISHDVIEFIRNQELSYFGKAGQKFGVFGFPQAIVSSRGLKWELSNAQCTLGQENSCSNELTQDEVTITVKGDALVIRPFFPSSL